MRGEPGTRERPRLRYRNLASEVQAQVNVLRLPAGGPTMRWPWQTREDEVLRLLTEILDDIAETRTEHSDILAKLKELTDE